MTNARWNRAVLTALAAVAAFALPTAQAHGAAEPREIDTRVLLDDDGLLGYGGCAAFVAGGCPSEGLDLVVVEAREAWLGDEPALVLRIVFQTDSVHDGRGLRLAFTANGTEHVLRIADADVAATSVDADLVQGPMDAFDGHPKAVDAWITYDRIGAAAGGILAGITAATTHHDTDDDIAPGTWIMDGEEAPYVPTDPTHGVPHEPEAASYTLQGPATLLTLAGDGAVVDLARGANATVRLANPLATFGQDVRLTLVPAPGVAATLDRPNLTLDAAGTRTIAVTVDPSSASGNVTVIAESDLGGRAVHVLQVVGRSVPPPGSATTETQRNAGEEAAAPAALVLPPLALALAARRRRRA